MPLTHIYMIVHFPGLVQALQLTVMGSNLPISEWVNNVVNNLELYAYYN